MLTSAKLRTSWYYKVYFMKLYLYVYLHTKFQVSSIILTSFRRGNFAPPPPQNELLKIPPRLRLNVFNKFCYWKQKSNDKISSQLTFN